MQPEATYPVREVAVPWNRAECHRRGSSSFVRFFVRRRSRPAACQSRGYQRKEQFVMASDGIAPRPLSFAAMRGSGGTLNYILQRTVVLNKVEVGGGDRAKRNAEIAHNGDGFQENLGKQHSGAPIEIDASGMHLLHQGAKETEIEVRGGAEGGAVGGAVHVGDIGADGDVH